VTAAGVIGTVGGYRADLFAVRDLVEQVRPHRAIAVAAGGEFHRPDIRSSRVHGQMDLAPLASALNTVHARLPLAISKALDPGAIDKQVEQPVGAPIASSPFGQPVQSNQTISVDRDQRFVKYVI